MKVLLYGPINSLSGYGARTRSLYSDLINLSIIPDLSITHWGNTLDGYEYMPTDGIADAYDHIFYVGMLDEIPIFPDGIIHYVTAGIETDMMYDFNLPPGTEILTSSRHSSRLIKVKNQVLPESILVPTRTLAVSTKRRILIAGAWIGGSKEGEDRKNIPRSIAVAMQLIAQSDNPSQYELVILTSMGTYSEIERSYIENYLIHLKQKFQMDVLVEFHHGMLSEKELFNLYESCQLMFTLTHGEGFGRHIAEFMALGGKVVAPKYSGYLDFADTSDNILLDVEMVDVPTSIINKWILPGSHWANVSDQTLIKFYDQFNSLPESFWNEISIININSIKTSNDTINLLLKEILFTNK